MGASIEGARKAMIHRTCSPSAQGGSAAAAEADGEGCVSPGEPGRRAACGVAALRQTPASQRRAVEGTDTRAESEEPMTAVFGGA
jgi:hypothetical protein